MRYWCDNRRPKSVSVTMRAWNWSGFLAVSVLYRECLSLRVSFSGVIRRHAVRIRSSALRWGWTAGRRISREIRPLIQPNILSGATVREHAPRRVRLPLLQRDADDSVDLAGPAKSVSKPFLRASVRRRWWKQFRKSCQRSRICAMRVRLTMVQLSLDSLCLLVRSDSAAVIPALKNGTLVGSPA